MKHLILIFTLLLSVQAFSQQGRYDPNKEYPPAETIDEVVYDNHGIPVNATPKQMRKWQREIDREKRKYSGNRFIDRVGDGFVSLGRGIGRVAVYVGTGIVVTVIINSIYNRATNTAQ